MINTIFLRVGAVVTEMRKLYPTMTLQTFTLFLEVARKPGVEAVELKQRTGIAQPTISRGLNDLGEWAVRRNEPGLGLVRSERAADQRRVVYFLTEAGEQLAKRMLHYAEAGTPSWSVSG